MDNPYAPKCDRNQNRVVGYPIMSIFVAAGSIPTCFRFLSRQVPDLISESLNANTSLTLHKGSEAEQHFCPRQYATQRGTWTTRHRKARGLGIRTSCPARTGRGRSGTPPHARHAAALGEPDRAEIRGRSRLPLDALPRAPPVLLASGAQVLGPLAVGREGDRALAAGEDDRPAWPVRRPARVLEHAAGAGGRMDMERCGARSHSRADLPSRGGAGVPLESTAQCISSHGHPRLTYGIRLTAPHRA